MSPFGLTETWYPRDKKFRNDEIRMDDFELIESLNCRGTSALEDGFKSQQKTGRFHPVYESARMFFVNPNQPLNSVKVVLAKFLFELSKVANPNFYSISALLIYALHDCLNIYGYHFLLKLEHQNKQLGKILSDNPQQEQFCNAESADYISIIFEFFVRSYLKSYLLVEDFPIDFTLMFLKYLNSWMLKYKLTKLEVQFRSSF